MNKIDLIELLNYLLERLNLGGLAVSYGAGMGRRNILYGLPRKTNFWAATPSQGGVGEREYKYIHLEYYILFYIIAWISNFILIPSLRT